MPVRTSTRPELRFPMGIPNHSNAALGMEAKDPSTSNEGTANCTQSGNTLISAQLDGGTDHDLYASPAVIGGNYTHPAVPSYSQQQDHERTSHQSRHTSSVAPSPHQQTHTTTNTVRHLLPYCTTEPPLNKAQVIALSDVVGSLKELALLALCATSGDVNSLEKLESAMGRQTASYITDFFADEWEIDG
ncbi:opa3 domain-containing [Pyrenophora seminiperda CCB06]|uniref:Opa3 domain-containing n=1 Tax=Pyrenophora seminiperda CCB06 TaxID=1302712 RepID=A0A3M7LWR2_9PLEO|nr:opa3 domain-containing [Pyrenophora seminiperda CCB06]